MALTHEDLAKLKAWFSVDDHEFLQGNTYIKEQPITDRIESVDPAWNFEIVNITVRDNAGNGGKDVYTVTVHAAMTIKGATRHNTGMATVQRTNEYAETVWKNGKKEETGNMISGEANEGEKSATTDALKRCARLFGIGRYLLTLDNSVKDSNSLQRWFDANTKTWLDDTDQVAKVKYELAEMMESYNEASVKQAKADLDPRQFANADDYLKALEALTEGIYSPESTDHIDDTRDSFNAAAQETMRQVNNEPPPSNVIDINSEREHEAWWKNQVIDLTKFLYNDENLEYNPHQHKNSLKKRMADTSQLGINMRMSTMDAAITVMSYRAQQDLGIGLQEFPAALDGKSLPDFVKNHEQANEDFVQALRAGWLKFVSYAMEKKPRKASNS